MKKFILVLLICAAQANAYSSSYNDCITIAAMFDNTCTNNTPVTDWTKGSTVTCTGAMKCPGYAN